MPSLGIARFNYFHKSRKVYQFGWWIWLQLAEKRKSVIWFKKRWTHSGGVEVQMRLSTSNIWCQSMNPACWINSGKFWTVRLTYLMGHGRLAISEIIEGLSDFRINTIFLSETLCYNRRILFVLVILLVWLCSNHSYTLNKYLVDTFRISYCT